MQNSTITLKLAIGSKLACVRRVMEARGRLLSTKEAENSHEAIVPRDSGFSRSNLHLCFSCDGGHVANFLWLQCVDDRTFANIRVAYDTNTKNKQKNNFPDLSFVQVPLLIQRTQKIHLYSNIVFYLRKVSCDKQQGCFYKADGCSRRRNQVMCCFSNKGQRRRFWVLKAQ